MQTKTLGILGAGQLGKMLCERASPWTLDTVLLDAKEDFPAAQLAGTFITGDFSSAEDVIKLIGKCDTATIEIERVSSEGLRALMESGITVHPHPDSLDIIKDKGLQKDFYRDHDYPTSRYIHADTKQAVIDLMESDAWNYPVVLKCRTDGYDGRGVQICRSHSDVQSAMAGPYLLEDMVKIDTEISVIAVANESGEVRSFPAVEMVFDPEANLVDYLLCPAKIHPKVAAEAEELARKLIADLKICGLLAVEMFINEDGELLINEVAPRPHNSGHHTIEACNHSQFEMHLRGVLNWPLPEIKLVRPAAMINLIGSGETGPAVYHGWRELSAMPDVYIHLYNKKICKPGRKMGHITICSDNIEDLKKRIPELRGILTVEGDATS